MSKFTGRLILLLISILLGMNIAKASDVPTNTIPVEIKGKKFELLKSLDAPGFVILNNKATQEIELKDKSWFSPRVKVVGQTLKGKSQSLRIMINGGATHKSKVWNFGRDYISGYDGVIGIGAIPCNEIDFLFSSEFPEDPTYKLELAVDRGRYRSSIEVGGQIIEVRFNFDRENSMVNRKMGDLLVASGFGNRSETLISGEIAFGFERPLEKLILQDFEIGGINLNSVLSRVSPSRAKYLGLIVERIKDHDELEEIIVVGKSNKKIKYKTKAYIVLGKDWLGSCGKVRVDKTRAIMELYC